MFLFSVVFFFLFFFVVVVFFFAVYIFDFTWILCMCIIALKVCLMRLYTKSLIIEMHKNDKLLLFKTCLYLHACVSR